MMFGRRSFMITGAAAADFGTGGGAVWAAETPIRYPEPNVKVLDPRFQPYVLGNAAIERIAGGCRFTEGPVWFGDGRYLLWSDIPSDRILKWEEETGAISVFRRPSNYANGNTRDRQGRLITCEMDAQRLTRTEYDGTITVLADSFEGRRLTAPNDVGSNRTDRSGSATMAPARAAITSGIRHRGNCRSGSTGSTPVPAQ